MSKRICGKCCSHKVTDAGSYGGSTFFKCETCGQMGMLEKFPEMTVFHQITASPEGAGGEVDILAVRHRSRQMRLDKQRYCRSAFQELSRSHRRNGGETQGCLRCMISKKLN